MNKPPSKAASFERLPLLLLLAVGPPMMKPSLARPRIGRPKWLSFFLSFSPALARAAPIRWPSRAESSDSREEPAMSLWSEEKSHNIFAFWARARTIFASQQAKPVCLAELGSARAPLLFPPFLSEDPSSRWLQLERPAATHASARHTRASPLDALRCGANHLATRIARVTSERAPTGRVSIRAQQWNQISRLEEKICIFGAVTRQPKR